MSDYLTDKYGHIPPLGAYVETPNRHGHRGRVTDIHLVGCPEGAAWIMGQQIPVTPEQLDGPWVSILCHERGSVVVPADDVVEVAPFPFVNDYAVAYFADAKP